MIYEFVKYEPLMIDYQEYLKLVKHIPRSIMDERISDLRFTDTDLWFEATKNHAIEYLDKFFEITSSLNVEKKIRIEIDKKEISSHDYLTISPKPIQINRDFFCDETRPICGGNGCIIGSRIISNIKMKARKAKSIGITRLHRCWTDTIDLVISAQVKNLFDQEGIIGLVYEPIELLDADDYDTIPFELPFHAQVIENMYKITDEYIIKKVVCHEHFTTYPKFINNPRLCHTDLPNTDFVEISGYYDGQNRYHDGYKFFFVSRRVVELLLKHKIKGLTNLGFFLKTPISPVFISDE